MTREEAINALAFYRLKLQNGIYSQYIEAFSIAIAALRAQTEAEKNDPLTLEELREMDLNSPPIWDSCLNEWCAVRWITAAMCKGVSYISGGNRPLESGRFYRRKPEEETT